MIMFKKLSLFFVFALFIANVIQIEAQYDLPPAECVPWSVSDYPLTDFCTQFPGYEDGMYIFAPNENPFSTYEALVGSVGFLTEFFQSIANVDLACKTEFLAFTCANLLRPCVHNGDDILVYPVQPCQSFCQSTINSCQNFVDETGYSLGFGLYSSPGTFPIDCSVIDLQTNQTLYPETSYWINLSDNTTLINETIFIESTCNDFDGYRVTPPCRDPLKLNPDSGYCSFTCPLPSYTEDEYDGAKIMQATMGWLSWACTWFVIGSYIINPKLREFPSNLVIMTAFAIHIVSIGMILPSMAGHNTTWCGENDQYTNPPDIKVIPTDDPFVPDTRIDYGSDDLYFTEGGLCIFQGTLLHFGLLAATLWWGIIAFNMFLQIYFVVPNILPQLEVRRNKYILQGIYFGIGWGIPFLFALIPAAASKVGFGPGSTFCFLSPEDDNAWQLTFWFIPIGLILIGGTLFFIAAMGQIIRLLIVSWKNNSAKSLVKSTLPVFIRLLCFIFIFWLLYLFIFIHRIVNEAQANDVKEGYDEYMHCIVVESIAVDGFGEGNGCKLDDDAANYEYAMLQGFAISSLGTFLLISFLSFELFLQWGRIFMTLVQCGINRNFTEGWHGFAHVLKTGTTSSLTSKTGSKMTITSHMGSTFEGKELDELEDEVFDSDNEETSEQTQTDKKEESSNSSSSSHSDTDV